MLRPDKLRPWPSGTGSESEKRILYAIARALNPMLSLDIGTRWGSSAVQIASGVVKQPPKSGVVSIDIERTIHGGPQPVGKFIPDELRPFVKLLNYDAVVWLRTAENEYGLIYEDSDHAFYTTKAIYELAIERVLAPGGVIISHDAVHPKFKGAVVAGIRQAGIEPEVYLVDGDSCGLAIWQKPKKKIEVRWREETAIMEDLHEQKVQTEDKPETTEEKPKRKRRKKASKKIGSIGNHAYADSVKIKEETAL